MIDRQNAVLIVKALEPDQDNPEIVNHVMEKTPELHFRCTDLVGEDGTQYPWEWLQRKKPEEGMVEYVIEFVDKTLRLPVGTVLHPGPEEWRKDIPNCGIDFLEYESFCSPPELDEDGDWIWHSYNEVKIIAQSNGDVNLYQSLERTSPDCQLEEARLKMSPERIDRLFKDLLRCVSEVDCYTERWCDDTFRGFTFHFQNGDSLQYGGVFCYDEYGFEINTEQIIGAFIEECKAAVGSTARKEGVS